MSLELKIQRFMTEARQQNLSSFTAAPPQTRLLWWLHINAVPPLCQSRTRRSIGSAINFGLIWTCGMALIGEWQWPRDLLPTLVLVAFYAFFLELFFFIMYRRLRFTPWNTPIENPSNQPAS